jgi:RNA polymerase primary sigma factor
MPRTKTKSVAASTPIIADRRRRLSSFEQILQHEHLLVELDHIMYHEMFDDDRMHEVITGDMPDLQAFESQRTICISNKEKGMPAEVAMLFNNPVLTREQEHHQFRKYNFLKYEAHKLMQRKQHSIGVQLQVRNLLQRAVELKKFLADCNVRLAIHIAKKHAAVTGQTHLLWQIVGEANLCIMKSISCFDFMRNVKFSTYSTWGIRNNLGRATHEEREHLNRYKSGYEASMDSPYETEDVFANTDRDDFLKRVVDDMLRRVDKRDGDVLRMYMLDPEEPTLEKVGIRFGLTKERIRQINNRCIKKMRGFVERGEVSLNGFLQEFVKDDEF